MEVENTGHLTEEEMQRLTRLFEIFTKVDKRQNVTGYFDSIQNARHDKNKHKQGTNSKAD